jgi:hypothetical protein
MGRFPSLSLVGGGGRHVEGVPGSGWNRWPERQAGFEINGQVGDNHQDAVVTVAEVLNQFRHGFTEGDVAEYAEAFSGTLADLMAKPWPEGTSEWTMARRGREVQSRLRRPPSETSEFPRRSARTLEQLEGAAEAVPRIFRITIPLSVLSSSKVGEDQGVVAAGVDAFVVEVVDVLDGPVGGEPDAVVSSAGSG